MFFPEEFRYSITDVKKIKMKEGEPLQTMNTVEVKSGPGKTFKGTLIYTGNV